MIGSKVNLDIRAILAELDLSMEQLYEDNVLESSQNIQVDLPFTDSLKLFYHKESHILHTAAN
jgi:hypothetical protein